MQFTLDFLEVFLYGIWLTLPLLMSFTLLVLALGQVVGRIEQWSAFDAGYWSLITAFTVGYGDFRPLQRTAKVLSIVIALLGIMFTGVVVAITVAAATSAFEKNVDMEALEAVHRQASYDDTRRSLSD